MKKLFNIKFTDISQSKEMLEIINNESYELNNKNRLRMIYVYNYAIKNKLVTPNQDGSIYIAENQIEDTFLRLNVSSKTENIFDGEIKQYTFISRFNHKRILIKQLHIDDNYKEMRKTKSGYLSYKEYMNLNGVFENMNEWMKYINKGKKDDNITE